MGLGIEGFRAGRKGLKANWEGMRVGVEGFRAGWKRLEACWENLRAIWKGQLEAGRPGGWTLKKNEIEMKIMECSLYVVVI